MRLLPTLTSLLLLAIPLNAGADAADGGKVDFESEVQPILKAHCYACHGPDADDGGLQWDSKQSAFRGGDSGLPAVVPQKVGESELIRRLTTDDDSERMPPDGEGEPLNDEQVALLKRWIEQGAPWPAEVVERNPHWAYVPPVRPELPAVKNTAWPNNEIDYFILAKLEEVGLTPNPQADRARLLRRVSLDLIGLPPTPDEVSAFVADESPDAYERVVDRLLASPRYGERWAQRWLDLARYADSNGFQRDGFRTVWAYRDYVIKSFNDDKPFDQFAVEQLAGDLLPEPTAAQLVATGFHRGTTVNVEAGVNQEENRVNQVFDRVNVTGTVFLGTTLECAQCHNHKYDPITQREYYQMFAYFNNTPIETKFRTSNDTAALDFVDAPAISVPLPGELAQQRETLQTEYEQLKAEWQQQREASRKLFTAWDAEQTKQLAGDAWKMIEVKDFAAVEQVQHELLADGSILISGPNPDKNTFTVTAEVDVDRIAAIKLEALTHKSLPGNGPGRKSDTNPNFVLTHFTITARAGDGEERDLVMHEAQADYHAANFHPARSLDANDQNGWAIHGEFGKPHWATFLVKEPLATEGPTKLTFQLVQNYGERRTLGRFRLWVNESTAASAKHPPHVVEVLRIPAEMRTEAQRNGLLEHYLQSQPELQEMRDRMAKMEEKLESLPGAMTLVMRELDSPRMTNLLRRGSFESKGIEVTPGVLEALHPLPNDAQANRLGLARWIAADDNPLFARVTVNRWWSALFGDGLVATEEDFGTQGDRPTHPELLDWLAVEFREHDYSMKHIHKKLVMSATYRQSAAHRKELRERDALNRLHARGPRMRLPAEMIRDNALAVSGLLHHELGGPPVKPPQPPKIWRVTGKVDNAYKVSEGTDRYRRGLYVIWRRSAPYPSFVNFDAPDRSSCVVERANTNTPLQALTLLNDEVYIEAALALAARLLVDLPEANPQQRVDYALQLAVARQPRPEETAHLVALYEDQLKRHQAEPNKAKQLVSAAPLPAAVRAKQLPEEELAAWYYVASVILNLDETISK